MLDNILQGLVPTGKTQLTGINGGDITKIGDMGDSLQRIKQRMKLPKSVSAQQVLEEAEHTGKIEAQLALAQEIVNSRGRELDQLVRLHEINVKHTQKLMQVDERLRTIQAEHGKTVARYQLGAAETQVNLGAFETVYDVQAEKIFGQ